jgi:hypothetical protein
MTIVNYLTITNAYFTKNQVYDKSLLKNHFIYNEQAGK